MTFPDPLRDPKLRISPHFTLGEMTRTNVKLPNIPGAIEIANLTRLCHDVLERIRGLYIPRLARTVGAWHVESGYRSPDVNDAVGGEERSAHLDGRAADGWPVDPAVFVADVMDALCDCDIPFDRAIYERPFEDRLPWLHLQVRSQNGRSAHQRMLMCVAPRSYVDWNPTHPRVLRA